MSKEPAKRIDLRSDTVTQPTQAMRLAIGNAEVGDDVLGDDPTVQVLQKQLATMLGKEDALLVPSGTMSNSVAIRAQTQPGDEIITETNSHIYIYEGGGYAALSGCSVALVKGRHGIMDAENVTKAIRKSEGSLSHFPNGRLVCVENTSNRGGGTCYPQEILDEISKVAHDNDCNAHMDGARLFNAVISTGVDAARMVRDYDSISICLSKGLGAPIGSVLVGSSKLIARAHRWRKMFGGGMRQVGLIAAGGLHAINNHIQRLADDHLRARQLAEAVSVMDGFTVDIDTIETNMVYVKSLIGGKDIVDQLAAHGVDVLTVGQNMIRAVTHLHITDEDIEQAIAAFEKIAA
jgi:threonine aldolase